MPAPECPACKDTGLVPMYDGAEKDGNFWRRCDDCGRLAKPGAKWPTIVAGAQG